MPKSKFLEENPILSILLDVLECKWYAEYLMYPLTRSLKG